jgi:hypothetical protein
MLIWAVAACGGTDEEAGTPAETVQQPAPEVAAPPPASEQEPAPAEQAPVQQAPRQTAAAAYDEPWTPEFTGTVDPGMSYDAVVGVWGEPVAERSADGRQYLYFRNGCEASCGTFDVVFLENGAVVDAIVRGPGHTYSGASSSPPGQEAVATLPMTAGG